MPLWREGHPLHPEHMRTSVKKIFIYSITTLLALLLVVINMAFRQSYFADPDHFCAADRDIYKYTCQNHIPLKILWNIPALSQNESYFVLENVLILILFGAAGRLITKKYAKEKNTQKI